MKAAACALNQTPLDWNGNLSRIKKAIEHARTEGAEIILLPELCLSGYGCEDYFFMPWIYEKAMEILLSQIVPASDGIVLALGFPLSLNGRNYNSLAICIDGTIKGFYCKQILAASGVFYENRWFEAWPANTFIAHPQWPEVRVGDFTLPFKDHTIGFEICEDGWHPEDRPAVRGAARKADIVLNASASNFARGKLSERHRIIESLQGRHKGWYLYANLLGNESGNLIFDGELMLGKAGKVLRSSPILQMDEIRTEVFELDEHANWPGALPPASDFEEFTAAACLGLRDYLRKSGSKGFTLSLSGGADFAACAVLVSEMLRRAGSQPEFPNGLKDILCCVYQASNNSGNITRKAAEELALALGAEFHYWDISPQVEQYTGLVENSLKRELSWNQDDLSLQNIQARSRAPGIWMLANTRNHLLITTGNRSEADVGYCTMDGDTAGSLAPIAGVSKHFIRQWLVWARDEFRLPVLDLIIHQEPTAELRPGKQTDEGDLMPYELLEQIEVLFLREKLSPENILEMLCSHRTESREYLEQNIQKFLRLWKRNQWKRERMAPSFHLDRFNVIPRSMGRYPIFCG